MFFKKENVCLGLIIVMFNCSCHQYTSIDKSLKTTFFKKNNVLITAHRGDWRNFPENSLEGLKSCVHKRIDIMEVDLKMTKDSVLILMHDKTLDRTTTGKGYVNEWTFDSIQTLYLKNGYGFPTPYKIPTLKQALTAAKGKIFLDLDSSYSYFKKAYYNVKEAGMLDQVIFRVNDEWEVFFEKYKAIIPNINYMPLLNKSIKEPLKYIKTFLNAPYPPYAIEVLFEKETSSQFLAIKNYKGFPFMINTIYPNICANHDDSKAIINKQDNWGWVVNKGARIIGTDRPALLLDFLRKNGCHK